MVKSMFDLLLEFAKTGPEIEKALQSSTAVLSPLHRNFVKLVNEARREFDLGPVKVPQCPTYEGASYKGGKI